MQSLTEIIAGSCRSIHRGWSNSEYDVKGLDHQSVVRAMPNTRRGSVKALLSGLPLPVYPRAKEIGAANS